jgi:hypothetical protein
MRIHLNEPGYLADIAAYLNDAGCVVRRLHDAVIEVHLPHALNDDHARIELEIYMTAWLIGRDGVSAELVP